MFYTMCHSTVFSVLGLAILCTSVRQTKPNWLRQLSWFLYQLVMQNINAAKWWIRMIDGYFWCLVVLSPRAACCLISLSLIVSIGFSPPLHLLEPLLTRAPLQWELPAF